jgi:hypothetical protein
MEVNTMPQPMRVSPDSREVLALQETYVDLLYMTIQTEHMRWTIRPSGFPLVILLDGLTTSKAATLNLYSVLPTLVAVLRRWRRGPWLWAVTVRQSPFAGYKDLLHERYDEPDAARRRAAELTQLIIAGRHLWPSEWGW